MALDPKDKMFTSGSNVELYEVRGSDRRKLKDGAPLEVFAAPPPPARAAAGAPPPPSALLSVAGTTWAISPATHTMRSTSEAGEPTFIFSSVVPNDPEVFYCTIFQRGQGAAQLEVLEQILGKLSTLHMSKNAKKNQVPFNLPLPQIDPKTINEIMRKGAEDTQMLLKQAGDAANQAFLAAAEMHKKYAPKPSEAPVAVSAEVKAGVGKTKQAAAAGAAVAKGVATGMQAATTEIGTNLASTVASAAGGGEAKDGKGGGGGGGAKVPQPVAAVGGIGMELLRDIAAVRDAMLDAAGSAWQGARAATVDVMQYQYGSEVAQVTAESCDTVEGIASMGVAMKMAQPTQVVLTSSKQTSSNLEAKEGAKEGENLKKKLEDERAALERERAALAAERARLQQQQGGAPAAQQQQQQQQDHQQQQQQQQRKGPWPFAFA